MFDGIKNSFKNISNSSKITSAKLTDMAKEMKDMPYNKLTPVQIAYIVFALVVFILIGIFIYPMINHF